MSPPSTPEWSDGLLISWRSQSSAVTPKPHDAPESFASAVHLLRQPPDYPEALSLPLPLHLAGLGQDYVLPHRASPEIASDVSEISDPVKDPDPAQGQAPGLEEEADVVEAADQLALFDS